MSDGTKFQPPDVSATANATIDQLPEARILGEHHLELIDREPTLYMSSNGTRTRAAEVRINAKFKVELLEAPFAFRRYADASAGKKLTDVAIAPFTVDGASKGDFIVY